MEVEWKYIKITIGGGGTIFKKITTVGGGGIQWSLMKIQEITIGEGDMIQWSKWNKMNCELMLTYDTPALRQTRNRNLMGSKTLPTIWGTYMKLVTKYQISTINGCWEKCDEKCAYMFNVYKNQLSRQTGSRNLTGPKMLPTIWYTYMTLVIKYQISAINSYWEKCDKKYLGRTEGRTVVKQYTPLPLRGVGV